MSKGIIAKIDRLIVDALELDQSKKMSGNDVAALLKENDPGLNDNSIRQRLSLLARDPTSEVAKLDGQNGYYRRDLSTSEESALDPAAGEITPGSPGRQGQSEEKFRYLVRAWLDQQAGEEPIFIEHTKSKKGKDGLVNKWKFPDLISVRWTLPRDQAKESQVLDWSYQTAKQNLGEPVYSLKSIELKPAVNKSNARGYFFQALSNSRWAHEAQLLIAEPLEGIVADELRRLGASYGLTIAHFGLSSNDIEQLPLAKSANVEEFQRVAQDIEPTIVVQGQKRDSLDWEHIYDIAGYLDDFKDVFSYIDSCCSTQKSPSFEAWKSNIRDA